MAQTHCFRYRLSRTTNNRPPRDPHRVRTIRTPTHTLVWSTFHENTLPRSPLLNFGNTLRQTSGVQHDRVLCIVFKGRKKDVSTPYNLHRTSLRLRQTRATTERVFSVRTPCTSYWRSTESALTTTTISTTIIHIHVVQIRGRGYVRPDLQHWTSPRGAHTYTAGRQGTAGRIQQSCTS